MTREEAVRFIAQTGGRLFAVEFVKRTTGELRVMNCRLDVRKHLTRPHDGPPEEPGVTVTGAKLIKVFDMVKRGYRSIPVDGITRIKVNGVWHPVTDSPEPGETGRPFPLGHRVDGPGGGVQLLGGFFTGD